jgi:putative transcriptional regulator
MNSLTIIECQANLTAMVGVQNGLKELRTEFNWTQQQLAAAVGVSRQSINNIERGRYVPSLELALMFAQLFECPVDEIFWLNDGQTSTI